MPKPRTVPAKEIAVVGVGASAGGLEAFTALLKHLPSDTGLTFVLVQHLDPLHESALTQILSRATSMPVREVTNNLRVEANHVYIIPPNTNLGIAHGVLKLLPRQQTGAVRSIDFFFEALAQDQHEGAIGVILSGTASDGTLGLEAIKAEGGITFAQDESAKYDSMPRSAVAAGCVDLVLKPEDIAKELVRIAKHPYVADQTRGGVLPQAGRAATAEDDGNASPPRSGSRSAALKGANGTQSDAPASDDKIDEDNFRKILLLLRNHCGADFSLYKSATIQRRATRRMLLSQQETLQDYVKFLRGNVKELDALYSDVLINVTNFFRDPEAFDRLKQTVFPKLLQQRGDEPLRAWVLGCSTGQEAYSIAMSLVEASEKIQRARKVQLFATDLNEAVLERARRGFYAKTLVQDVSPERLRRFFVEEAGGYRIAKPLREMVVFARQNLISDPPFSRMDFISCRNLLIYLGPDLQKRAFPTFHYSLNPEGFLFLGASESTGAFTNLFEPVDKKHRIFSRKNAPSLAVHRTAGKGRAKRPPSDHTFQVRAPIALAKGRVEVGGFRTELSAEREADRVTVNQFAPPGVLVNSELQIVQFRGATNAYLEPATGKATFDVLKMAREGLMLPLRAAINKAKKEDQPARKEDVQVKLNGKTQSVNVEVIPLKNLRERSFLILFENGEKKATRAAPREPGVTPTTSRPASKKEESRRIVRLERELSETRDYLQSIQEQYEAANEELHASNEEGQSANEELQSVNEEMETSKEELESANEELTTVNDEMASRNAELNRLNSDLVNIETSTRLAILAIVLLGHDLTIRRFSAQAEKHFNLQASDLGRPIGDLRHNLFLPAVPVVSDRALSAVQGATFPIVDLVRDVIATGRDQEREALDKDGRWYSVRARPYLTFDKKIDGAVIVVVDIDDLKRAQHEVKAARDYAEAIVRTTRDPLIVLRADLSVNTANEAYYRMFKTTPADTEGRSIFELSEGAWKIPKLRTLLEDILPRNGFFNDFEVTHDFPRIGLRTMLLNSRRLDLDAGTPMVLLTIGDVTDRLRALEATTKLAAIVQATDDAIFVRTLEGVITSWNPGAERMFGYGAHEIVGKNISMLVPPAHASEAQRLSENLTRGERVTNVETERVRKNGSIVSVSLSISPLRDSAGQLTGASVTARDITENKKAAEQMRVSEIRFRRLFEAARDGVLLVDSVSRKITDANPFMTELLGYSRAELLGHELWQIGLLEDEKAGHAAFREIQEKGSVRYEDLPLQSKSGQKREVEVVANLYEENGKQVVQCNIRDITERKAADDRVRLLMNELAHRSKNLIALIQSIASRSLTGARTLAEANQVFGQRIQALARSQSVLVGGGLEGGPIAEIIQLESEGFTERITASGPPVAFSPKAAQTFALLVHELATNATKYGALSRPEGHVAIDWRIEGEAAKARFKFRWREHGGPTVVPPSHTGFGRTLLERAVAQDFGAKSKISFATEGVIYEIDAPLLAVAPEGLSAGSE